MKFVRDLVSFFETIRNTTQNESLLLLEMNALVLKGGLKIGT